MLVSIVILNYKGRKYLEKFLPPLIKSIKAIDDVEIVVADNGSKDDSVQTVKENFPTVRIIELDDNYGFAGGYNRALKEIKSEYYVLLNSDIEVSENWLKVLLDYMQSNADVVACQPKIKSYNHREYFEYAGAAGGFIDKYGFPYCRGRIFGKVEKDEGQYDDIIDVFWASGACMMIRSEDYWKAGALDEDFFAHMEEIDLCWRLKSRGKRIVCIPDSVVYHIGGGTLSNTHPRKTYLNYRNNLIMLYKNLPHNSINSIFRTRFWLDNIAATRLTLAGKFKMVKAIFSARTHFKLMKEKFTEKRKDNILHSVQSAFNEISDNSIVYEYFIKGHKTFNELEDGYNVEEFQKQNDLNKTQKD